MAAGGPQAPIFGGWGYDPVFDEDFEVAIYYLTCEGTLDFFAISKSVDSTDLVWGFVPALGLWSDWSDVYAGYCCEDDYVWRWVVQLWADAE
jgi:hypothetical protein